MSAQSAAGPWVVAVDAQALVTSPCQKCSPLRGNHRIGFTESSYPILCATLWPTHTSPFPEAGTPTRATHHSVSARPTEPTVGLPLASTFLGKEEKGGCQSNVALLAQRWKPVLWSSDLTRKRWSILRRPAERGGCWREATSRSLPKTSGAPTPHKTVVSDQRYALLRAQLLTRPQE